MSKVFKSFHKTVGGAEGSKCKYPERLDTYGCGCFHDCCYCYAKSLLSFRKLWNPLDPSVASIKDIAKVIPKLTRIVRLGGMTDCFQPQEEIEGITRQTLLLLKAHKKPYLIVTKSNLVATDKYVEALDKKLAHIQITVPFSDYGVSRWFEKAPPPVYRIDAIKKLQSLGFDVALRLSPYIPSLVDVDIINAVKVKKVVEFLRVNHWIEKWLGPITVLSEYTLKENGYRHLPLEKKKEYLSRLTGRVTVCDDVQEHYTYFREHFNPNKEDCCDLQ